MPEGMPRYEPYLYQVKGCDSKYHVLRNILVLRHVGLRRCCRWCWRRRGRGHLENRIVRRHIEFNLGYGELLLLLTALESALRRKRKDDPVHLFVVANRLLHYLLASAHRAHGFFFDLEEGIGIDVDRLHVAILEGGLQLIGVGAFQLLLAEEFDLVAF